MARRQQKPKQSPQKPSGKAEVPPGATRKALDRPQSTGSGKPGSGAGPRHAAGDPGSDIETVGRVESSRSAASPPEEQEDTLDRELALSQPAPKTGNMMRLTGFHAIEYAEKQGLTLNKHPDSIIGPRQGLSIAEAEAIAAEDPSLIWINVSAEQYYFGPPTDFEPER